MVCRSPHLLFSVRCYKKAIEKNSCVFSGASTWKIAKKTEISKASMKPGQTPWTFPPHQQRMRMRNAILYAQTKSLFHGQGSCWYHMFCPKFHWIKEPVQLHFFSGTPCLQDITSLLCNWFLLSETSSAVILSLREIGSKLLLPPLSQLHFIKPPLLLQVLGITFFFCFSLLKTLWLFHFRWHLQFLLWRWPLATCKKIRWGSTESPAVQKNEVWQRIEVCYYCLYKN